MVIKLNPLHVQLKYESRDQSLKFKIYQDDKGFETYVELKSLRKRYIHI